MARSLKVTKEKLGIRRKRTSTYSKLNSTNIRRRTTSNRNCSEIDESKKIAAELRLEFGLPQLRIKPRVEAIQDIEGMLETRANIGESPVDAIKAYRQNLS